MRAGRIVALVGVIVVAGGVGCESEDDYVSMGGDAGAAGALAEASGGTASGGRGSQPLGGTPSSTGGTPSSTGGTPSSTGGTPSSTGGTPSSTGGTPSSMGGSAGEASEPTAGTSGEDSCDAFDDEESPGDITVRISNGGDAPIFLGPTQRDLCSLGDIPVFEIGAADGPVTKIYKSICETTCEGDREGAGVCPPACYKTHVVRIEPGGSFDSTWDGRFFNHVVMPSQCYLEPPANAGHECLHGTAAENGLYTLYATAWSDIVCEPAGDCECLDGSCMPESGMNVTGTSRDESLEFSYPTADRVEIHFD